MNKTTHHVCTNHVAQQSLWGDDGLATPIQPPHHWLREGWFNTDQTIEPQKMVTWHILDKIETFSKQNISQDLCCRCTKPVICNFLMMTFNGWLKVTQVGTAPPEGKPLATLADTGVKGIANFIEGKQHVVRAVCVWCFIPYMNTSNEENPY